MSTPHRVHLPAAPRKGLVMRVQPRDGSWGFNVTVQRVNGRSFYASVDGQSERHLIGQWSTWLRNLQKRGDILLNGVPAVVPGIQFNWTFTPSREELVTIRSRLKSALETTRTYQIRRSGTDEDLWTYAVVGGRREYCVRAHPEWAETPSCDCEDAVHRKSPWCKHSMAVLMTIPELRCQLLDVLMEAP